MTFKSCPACGFKWPSLEDLLSDAEVELVGYQVNFKVLTTGIMLFNHSCKGTMGIYVVDFEALYSGPIFKVCLTGSPECPGYCVHQDNLRACPAQCECAYVREIIQIIKSWPKNDGVIGTATGSG